MTSSVLALAMMGVLHTPIQDKVIDLSIKGSTLRVIGEELGKEAGWTPTFDPSVANEVLVLRTKGMKIDDVLVKIAEVTGTKWTLNGDQMLVQPDFTVRNAALAKVRAKNAKAIIDSRIKYYDTLKTQTYKDGEEEYTYEPEKEALLLGDMVRGLSDQFLTTIAPGQRVVLSSNPTSMQRPLGRVNVQGITEWIAQENESRKLSEDDRQQMMNDPEYQQYMEMFGGRMEAMIPKPITEAPQKVLLIVERFGRNDFDPVSVSISLRVMGSKGNTLLETQTVFSEYNENEYEMGMLAPALEGRDIPEIAREALGQDPSEEAPRKPMPGDDIPITVSADTKAVFEAAKVDYSDRNLANISKRTREIMMRTDLYDPMQFELGEFLLDGAEKRDLNFVAVLPDQVRQYGNELPAKLGDVRDRLPEYDLVETEAGGWWSVLPNEPGSVWAGRIDRQAFTGTLMAAQNRFFVPLDTLATFLFRFPDANENSMVSQRLQMFAPQMQTMMGGLGDDESMMRVFGGMTQQERQIMRNGGSIPIGRLSAGPRGVLQEKFFGYMPTVTPVDLEKDMSPQTPVEMMSGMMGMGMLYGMGGATLSEPTEIMPVGLPANGSVSMRVNSESYVISMTKDGVLMPGIPPFGRNELAFFSLLQNNPEFAAQMQESNQMFQNLRTGIRDQLHMVVLIAPGMGSKSVLSDPHDPDMTKTYSIYNLPAEFKQQMDADAEALRKSPMGKFFEAMGSGMGGYGGGTIKP
jgi:hypothetical protein